MMPDPSILRPVFALAGWTVCMLLLIAFRRLVSGTRAGVRPTDYALGESTRVPAHVALPNRNYMNLLELPVLFYVGCLIAYASGTASPPLVNLAWAYVGLRVAHSLIHVTYNRILDRFLVFVTSNFVLVALWLLLARSIFMT